MDGIDNGRGQQEGFRLNEAGQEYFGQELTLVFEELMREYGAQDEGTLLSEPRLSVDLAERTHVGIERLADFLMKRVVERTILSGVNERGEKRPRKVNGDPIKEMAVLNDSIFVGNFPAYGNLSMSTPEGVLLNRLLRTVRGGSMACFAAMSHVYESKEKSIGRGKKLPKEDLDVIAFYQIIGSNFDEAIARCSMAPDRFTASLIQICVHLYGIREFIGEHRLAVPREVDTAKLRAANERIFDVIRRFREPGIPLVINPKQEGKALEKTVTEISPLRPDGHEFGRVLAQISFFDEKYAGNEEEIAGLAAANLAPMETGAQSIAVAATQNPNRERKRLEPGSMQFFIERFNGEISALEVDHRALRILLGDSLYEIMRNAALVELAQIVCSRDILQKHLSDLLEFDPARKPSFRGKPGKGKGGSKSHGKTVRNFPRIFQSMIDNAEPSEPTGIERGPISPHARLLPPGRYPSNQAVTSAQNAGEIVKEIPQEIRDRSDVKTKVARAVGFGYAVSWYEQSDRPEYAGRLIRRDVRSDEIEEMAKTQGVSVNDVVDRLIGQHRDQQAALRFYTYVSREDPGTVDAIQGRTEASVGGVIEKLNSQPDVPQKSS